MAITATKYTPVGTSFTYLTFSAGVSAFTAVGDISVKWQREVQPFKLLSDSAPTLLWGKTTGEVRVGTFSVIPSAAGDNTFLTAWPPASASTGSWAINAPGGTATFTGYVTGKQSAPRQLASRVWVVDGGSVLEIAD